MSVTGIADYRFVESLGAGNHGEFYLAERPERVSNTDAEFVAVKVLGLTATDDAARRAAKELRLFAEVPSPYLVSVYDAGQDGELFFYSMEYLPIGSLAAASRRLERSDILRAVHDAALAAHDLHEHGIVHRDIKPSNILLHETGAKLSDLGLAQILAPGLTVTGMGSVDSVEYTDRAVLQGARPSRASDIYSLGATLHRALSGAGLYGELPANDALLALRTVLKTSPELAPGLSRKETALMRACIADDPGERPDTAREVAQRIESL